MRLWGFTVVGGKRDYGEIDGGDGLERSDEHGMATASDRLVWVGHSANTLG